MKLIRKLNRQYIIYSFVVLLIAGIALFFIIKALVEEETDEKLVSTFNQIEQLLGKSPRLFNVYPIIEVQEVSKISKNRYFSDTTLNVMNEMEEYRQLVGYASVQNKNYKITIRESGIESDDLFETLTIIVILGFLILLISLYVINKRIAQKIWSPFFENLEKLKQFSLQSLNPFIPTETETDEFNEMNNVLKSLTDKVISDYDNLKKFSENASHELQTPLAIIRSKIETLLDENVLSPSQVEKIGAIYQTVNRLSKINSGLVLLTKIENRQFKGHEEIDLNHLIRVQIESFNELIEMKGLEYKYECRYETIIKGDKILVDMLMNNLLGNAILHNKEKGRLIIELDMHFIKFSNSGEVIIPESRRLFERFYQRGATGSTGLGLAISKQICRSFGWDLNYTFKNQLHIFTVTL